MAINVTYGADYINDRAFAGGQGRRQAEIDQNNFVWARDQQKYAFAAKQAGLDRLMRYGMSQEAMGHSREMQENALGHRDALQQEAMENRMALEATHQEGMDQRQAAMIEARKLENEVARKAAVGEAENARRFAEKETNRKFGMAQKAVHDRMLASEDYAYDPQQIVQREKWEADIEAIENDDKLDDEAKKAAREDVEFKLNTQSPSPVQREFPKGQGEGQTWVNEETGMQTTRVDGKEVFTEWQVNQNEGRKELGEQAVAMIGETVTTKDSEAGTETTTDKYEPDDIVDALYLQAQLNKIAITREEIEDLVPGATQTEPILPPPPEPVPPQDVVFDQVTTETSGEEAQQGNIQKDVVWMNREDKEAGPPVSIPKDMAIKGVGTYPVKSRDSKSYRTQAKKQDKLIEEVRTSGVPVIVHPHVAAWAQQLVSKGVPEDEALRIVASHTGNPIYIAQVRDLDDVAALPDGVIYRNFHDNIVRKDKKS